MKKKRKPKTKEAWPRYENICGINMKEICERHNKVKAMKISKELEFLFLKYVLPDKKIKKSNITAATRWNQNVLNKNTAITDVSIKARNINTLDLILL